MARKLRNRKSGSKAFSSKNQPTGRTHAPQRNFARSTNRSNNQHPNLSTQNFPSRTRTARAGSLPLPTTRRAREKPSRRRSLALLSDLRAGKSSYSKLLSDYRLDTRTARKYLGAALRTGPSGRVHASKSDRLMRELLFPLSSGDLPTRIRGSNAATQLSEYFHDRDKLLRNKMTTEEFEAKWRGVRIAGQEVFADAATILLRADTGDLKVENLYASVGGAE